MIGRKVLFLSVVPQIGGAERVLSQLVPGLAEKGYSSILVTQEEGPLCECFRRHGGRAYILKLPAWRKGKNFFRRYGTVRKLAEIIRQEKVDIIHCNSFRLNPYALCSSRSTGIPFLTHIHDALKIEHARKFSVYRSAHLIVPSLYVKSCLPGYRGTAEIVPNGIDPGPFLSCDRKKVRKEFGIDDSQFLVGMVAHFVERKGHRRFIDAAARLKKKSGRIRFMIVGDDIWDSGISRDELIDYARKEGLDKELIFTGARSDIPEVLSAFDLFVLPSEKEAFGLVVIESMAAGVPVIVNTHAYGPQEIVSDGYDGIITDCNDPENLARSMLRLIEDKKLRKTLAERGRQTVVQKFAPSIFVSNIIKVYERLPGTGYGPENCRHF